MTNQSCLIKRVLQSYRKDACTMRINHLVLLLLVTGCSGPIGEDFNDVDAIGASDTWKDWVILGRFGPSGPFELTGISYCDFGESCEFSHDGQPHRYENFPAHKLAVLRLHSRDGEVSHVVLRSRLDIFGHR